MPSFTRPRLGRALPLALACALLASCDNRPPPAPKPPAPVATYTPAQWQDLPATADADLVAGFNAWRAGCAKLSRDAVWASVCAAATAVPPEAAAIRGFLEQQLQVYSLRSAAGPQGLITGYYEPVYRGSLARDASHTVPVYGVPDDLIIVSLDSLYPELKGKRLRGRLEGRILKPYDDASTLREKGANAPVLAWLASPMDLQFLQIQGSGRIQLANGRQLRIGYADQNGYPYKPVGRWLVEQGQLNKDEVSMGRIRAWAEANPQRIDELLGSNPSYVFFSTRPDSNEGPRGSLNVPLTDGYSVAIDRKVIPLGSLLWLNTTRPDGSPVQRPVAAQDTGGAIAGEVRADLFWGTGDAAGELAGNMKQSGQLWLLWPKGAPLPALPAPAAAPGA
ncbi:MltA domain-containing protein [Pseudomonas sp. NPDC007930]|uniref:murein transglycosylase A n=1 Tax=Pseudomonas sp. NPDC007930 TaxID=3364417 RepID=UPI0036F169F3